MPIEAVSNIVRAGVGAFLQGGGSSASDPFLSQVSLQLPFETLLDTGPKQLTVTNVGNSAISTTQVKVGTGSLNCTGSNYLTVNSSELAFGTGDFTIEAWLYWLAPSASTQLGPFHLATNSLFPQNTTGIALHCDGGGNYILYYGGLSVSSTRAVPANVWQHVAVSRQAGTTRLFVDGIQALSVADTANYTGSFGSIGAYYSAAYLFTGFIDQFRVTKGAGRYSADFTPSVLAFDAGTAGSISLASISSATVSIVPARLNQAVANVVNTGVTTSSNIMAQLAPNADWDADDLSDIDITAEAKAGSIDFCLDRPGPLVGNFKIIYQLG